MMIDDEGGRLLHHIHHMHFRIIKLQKMALILKLRTAGGPSLEREVGSLFWLAWLGSMNY